MISLRLLNYLDRYLTYNDYKITISSEGIHIMNYLEVVDFSNTKVVVRYDSGVNIFYGKDLVISKMLDDELVITGKLSRLEYN